MIEQLNKTQRLQNCFRILEGHNVVLMEYGRAIVYGNNTQPYKVNYTLETCECYENKVEGIKCEHIYAAQFRHEQVIEVSNA